MKTCLVIRHVAFEDLGIFEPALRDAGFAVDYRQAGVDAVTPEAMSAADLVVVLGGPIGVYETDKYPWLNDEIALIRGRLDAKKPLLGVCLGAQLMAAALGARVYPGPAKEIGWGAITLTPEGRDSALAPFGSPEAGVLHWHGDTFDLPAGAVRLASTAITPNQAFAIGDHALALQFHIEADPARIECWLIGHTGELDRLGIAPETLREQTRRAGAAATSAGLDTLRRWLARAGLAR